VATPFLFLERIRKEQNMCICDGDCDNCFYNYNVTCDHCGEEVHFCDSTGLRYGNNYILCGACEEDTACCVGCGERMEKVDMYEFKADHWYEYWCPECYVQEDWSDNDPTYVLVAKPGEEHENL
jgi:hypothetical protein